MHILRFGHARMMKVIKWIVNNIINKTDTILDIGCGNGVLLLQLVCIYSVTITISFKLSITFISLFFMTNETLLFHCIIYAQ